MAEIRRRQGSPSLRYQDMLAGECYLSLKDRNALKQGSRSPPCSPEQEEEQRPPQDGGLREIVERSGVSAEDFVAAIKTVKQGEEEKIRFSALADGMTGILKASNQECQQVWSTLESTGKAGLIPMRLLLNVLGQEGTSTAGYRVKTDQTNACDGTQREKGNGDGRGVGARIEEEEAAEESLCPRSKDGRKMGGMNGVERGGRESIPVPLTAAELDEVHTMSRAELEARLVEYMEADKGRVADSTKIEDFVGRLEEATKLVKSLHKEKKEALQKVKELTVKLERAQARAQ